MTIESEIREVIENRLWTRFPELQELIKPVAKYLSRELAERLRVDSEKMKKITNKYYYDCPSRIKNSNIGLIGFQEGIDVATKALATADIITLKED